MVIGIAGLAGAGKGSLAAQLALLGLEHFNGGEVVRATARANDFVPEDATRDAYMPFWREYSMQHGDDWLSRLAFAKAAEKQSPVVFDGVRILADAEAITAQGPMYWMRAELPVLAGRVMLRARKDDQHITTTEHYVEIMQKDLTNTGIFQMGAIRETCTAHLLPVPEIQNEDARAEAYHHLAKHVLKITGLSQ